MASVPPPQGMSEVDYEAIEAAVTETVRGRWFLAEFARRNRIAETRQLLEAMSRLEAAVVNGPQALPSADPSIRLMIQRIKEIAGSLGAVAGEMRAAGLEDHFVEAVDAQARAVSGMMRAATPSLGGTRTIDNRPALGAPPSEPTPTDTQAAVPMPPRLPRAELPASLCGAPPRARRRYAPRRPLRPRRPAAGREARGVSLRSERSGQPNNSLCVPMRSNTIVSGFPATR